MAEDDRMVRVGDLVTVTTIAERAGVTRAAVSNWRHRHADFPLPLVIHGEGARSLPVFEWPEVADWLEHHPPAIDPDAPVCACGRRLRGPYYDHGTYGWRHDLCPYCPAGSACRSTPPTAAGDVVERFHRLHDHPIQPTERTEP
jgi:hypothetical protein